MNPDLLAASRLYNRARRHLIEAGWIPTRLDNLGVPSSAIDGGPAGHVELMPGLGHGAGTAPQTMVYRIGDRRMERVHPASVAEAVIHLAAVGILPDTYLRSAAEQATLCPRCRHPLAVHGDSCDDCDCALPAKAVVWLVRRLAERDGRPGVILHMTDATDSHTTPGKDRP